MSIQRRASLSRIWCGLLLVCLLACGSFNVNSGPPKRVRDLRHPVARAHDFQSQLPQCNVAPKGSNGHPGTGPIAVVVDKSGSTSDPSGFDVDGDGVTGYDPRHMLFTGSYPSGIANTDPGDSVLVAEVLAACEWASAHMSGETVVGIVSFAGKADPRTGRADYSVPPARVIAELTTDSSEIAAGFNEILRLGSSGGTDYSAAITVATQMLAEAESDGGRKKKILFITDGVPTLPIGSMATSDPGDQEAAAVAALATKKAGIELHMILIGVSRQFTILDEIPDFVVSTGGTIARSETGENLAELMNRAIAH